MLLLIPFGSHSAWLFMEVDKLTVVWFSLLKLFSLIFILFCFSWWSFGCWVLYIQMLKNLVMCLLMIHVLLSSWTIELYFLNGGLVRSACFFIFSFCVYFLNAHFAFQSVAYQHNLTVHNVCSECSEWLACSSNILSDIFFPTILMLDSGLYR